jgi:hypothetical protein
MDAEVVEALDDDRTVVRRLLQLYHYDFSEFDGSDVNPHGEYLHRYLDEYWTDSDRKAFLFRVEGVLAGFALVFTGEPHDIAEFFVMRKYRARAGRGTAVDPGPGHQGSGEVAGHGTSPGPAVPDEGRASIDVLTDAYGDGLSFDFVCGDEVYGSGAALHVGLPGRGEEAAEVQEGLGGPLRRAGLEGRALVRLGLARHSLTAALPAGPPAPQVRRAGFLLLLRPGQPGFQSPADQGCRAPLARGGKLRVREGAASAWISARPGSTPRSCATSCWSWPSSRSAPSPQRCSGTAPTPRPRRPPGRATRRPPTPASSRSPSPKSGACSPARSAVLGPQTSSASTSAPSGIRGCQP